MSACPINDVPWGNQSFSAPIQQYPMFGSQAPFAQFQPPPQPQLQHRPPPQLPSDFGSTKLLGMRLDLAAFVVYILFAIMLIFLVHLNSKMNQMALMLNYMIQMKQAGHI